MAYQNDKSFIIPKILTIVCFLLFLGYWGYVKCSGTGYESNTWEHFRHTLKGVQFELGHASGSTVTEEELSRVLSDNQPVALENKSLVSVPFGQFDREFYIFLRPVGDRQWRVIAKPKSDYKGFNKIWLQEVSLEKSGLHFLVGAIGDDSARRFLDAQTLSHLPRDLKYTRAYIVYADRPADKRQVGGEK